MDNEIVGRRVWVYKCNDSDEAPWAARGDWAKFFRRPGDGRWGGEWSTKNPESLKIIRERMKPGDIVLCYQTDRREMVGVCELVRFVHTSRGFRKGRNLILSPVEKFQPTVKIHDLKHKIHALKMVRALQPGVKTLYEVTDQEAQILLSACGSRLGPPTTSTGDTKTRRGLQGGGFGSAAENRKVEERAVKLAKAWYKKRGYRVVSREKENIGYDLQCSKPGEEIHV